jgi:Xaa-Pro aminopeptidase
MEVAGRLDRLRARLPDSEIDALVVTAGANVRYLTGFTGSAGILVVSADAALLTTDGRYRTQAAEQLAGAGTAGAVDIVVGGAEAQRAAVAGAVQAARGPSTVPVRAGLEAEAVSWAAQRRWTEVLDLAVLVPTVAVVEALRLVKDAGELARMTRAAAIADGALAEVVGMLGEGRSEQEVALALDSAMRRLGAEDRAFETIVAGGPNSAKPHARPSTRPVGPGEPVVIDFGATFDGYRSDMTRTFCVGGDPGPELARVFDTVGEAQRRGVAAVVPGASAGAVDRVCRDHIAQAGWADAFEHGTGHGVGLDIHEAPSVSQGATAILTPGVVVTVEPGVYLAGVGGVRIEDTVVVTEDGCRPLTGFTKDIAA